MIYVFTIGVSSNNSPNSPPSFMKPLDQKLLFPYTTIFSKAINNRSIIECMKLSESTSFKIKNCIIRENLNTPAMVLVVVVLKINHVYVIKLN